MKKAIRVSIIGAGEIGQAIAHLVSHTGAHVEMWDADASKVTNQKPFEEVVRKADVLFFCVPSWVLRVAIKQTVTYLSRKTLCAFVSKGIEEKTRLFVDGLAKDVLPKGQPFALISGPMLAEELVDGHGGAAIVATRQQAHFDLIQKIFSCDDLRLTHTADVKSIAIAGVLKNVYAIALGIAAGLEWRDNRKGWLCTQAVKEMLIIMKQLKANPAHVLSDAGLGDFIATGFSKYSSNQTLGRELVEKSQCERKSEGCQALPSLVKRLGIISLKSLPILSALHGIILKHKKTKDIFEKLFCG